MQRELIQNPAPALPCLRVGARGQAVDAASIGEAQDVIGGAFGGQERDGKGVEGEGEVAGEGLAIVDEEARLHFVAAGNPGVASAAEETEAADGGGRRWPK